MFLVKTYDLQEIFELHFQPVFINNDDTKRKKEWKFKLKIMLCIKNNFTFWISSMVHLKSTRFVAYK